MLKYIIPLLMLIAHFAKAQETETPGPGGEATPVAQAADSTQPRKKTGLGNGLAFELSDGAYQFNIGGFMQPSFQYAKTDGQNSTGTLKTKRTYLNFSANALKEKVSLFIQADFSAGTPLLDAWAAYHFNSRWMLSAGQKRTFTNNREMTFNEDKLQFADRGFTSTSFTGNGREFGLFLEGKMGQNVVLVPQLAITSGDGPNSFGANSADVDLGGLKYGGRLDLFLFGEFKEGNKGFSADLKHEDKPKLLLGVAGSLNRGASNAKGEGHGNFIFYDASKNRKLPDLRKFSADLLLKYQGFSFLTEYVNTSAANLSGIYLDSTASPSQYLKPQQIGQYLILGNAYNVTAGYCTKSGYSLDFRYEELKPEFTDQTLSLLQPAKISTVGLSKYFKGNALKAQATVSQIQYTGSVKAMKAELVFQVVF